MERGAPGQHPGNWPPTPRSHTAHPTGYSEAGPADVDPPEHIAPCLRPQRHTRPIKLEEPTYCGESSDRCVLGAGIVTPVGADTGRRLWADGSGCHQSVGTERGWTYMTAEAVVMNKSAVALAADSAIT